MKKLRIMTALTAFIVSAFLLPQKVFAAEIDYYELYLGSTQVNSSNKHNILNQTDPDTGKPTASYDPATNVLELHSPGISGAHNDSLIYSELPLKVKGKLEGTYTCGSGFSMKGTRLEFFEDEDTKTDISITINQGKGGVVAGYTDKIMRSNVIVSGGNLYFEHSNGAAVACGDLTVNGGKLYMKRSSGGYGAAVCDQLVLGTGCRMKIPEGGGVIDGWIKDADGEHAPEVLIELEKYDLFVGGVQLDARNASDVLDDGKVSFTPAESGKPAVLTLDNAVIKVADIDNGYNNSAGIYVGDGRNGTAVNDLCIKLIGENTITLPSYTPQDSKISGILDGGAMGVTIDGSGEDGNGTLDIDLAWTGDTSRAVYGFYSSLVGSLDVRDAVLNMSLHSEGGTLGIWHGGGPAHWRRGCRPGGDPVEHRSRDGERIGQRSRRPIPRKYDRQRPGQHQCEPG